MICYRCKKASDCSVFRNLYSMSKDFSINECRNYQSSEDRCQKMIENKELMRLIYDYFTGQVETDSNYTDEEIKGIIRNTIWSL